MAPPAPTLETERLLGRPPADDRDFAALRLVHADPRVMATLSADGRPFSERDSRATLGRIRAHFDRAGYGAWLWFEKAGGDFVGYCGLKDSLIEGAPAVELLYGLRALHWRKGYGGEAARACLAFGFGSLGLEEIAAWTLPHNHGSRGVMTGQGFVFERTVIHAGLLHVFYRLRRQDWRGPLP